MRGVVIAVLTFLAANSALGQDPAPLAALAEGYDNADAAQQTAILRALEQAAFAAGPNDTEEVAQAFVALLNERYPEPVRRQALDGLAVTAGPEQAAAMAALLDHPSLGQAALRALASTPGSAVTEALTAALDRLPEPLIPSAIHALGMRNDPAAIPALTAIAQSEQPARWAALDALAMLGVPPHQVFPFPRDASTTEAHTYALAVLRAAQARTAQGDQRTAEGLYLMIAGSSNRRPIIIAALNGLADAGSEQFVPMALGYLHHPQAGAAVASLLRETAMPGVDEKLAGAFPSLQGPGKAVVLDILAARNAPAAHEITQQALEDADPLVRLRAQQHAGMTPDGPQLLAALDASLRQRDPTGFAEILALLMARAREAELEGLDAALVDVAGGTAPEAFRAAALDALAERAPRAGVSAARDLLDDPVLGSPAGRAFAAITARHAPREQAVELLAAMALQSPHDDVRVAALAHLKEVGADPAEVSRSGGWITDWRMPTPSDGDWVSLDQWPPRVDQTGAVACLIAEAAFPVILHITADTPYRLMLGEQTVASGTGAGSARITLERGENLLRIEPAAAEQGVVAAIRITNREGVPVNLNTGADAVDGQPRLRLLTREDHANGD